MKTKILTMLRQTDGHVSGQQLCETLDVSRTAVWKIIEQLKEEGYIIEAVRNKGYHLMESPDVMSESEIESLIETSWAGKRVLFLEETDSTNIQAKKQAEAGAEHGLLVVAEKQSAGKGRRGRGWNSPSGKNAYFSILLRPEIRPEHAPMLTLVMAVSVVQAVKEIADVQAMIKWPNDVILNGKKICGILTEMSSEIDYVNHVVIGAGINVNEEVFPDEIKEKATSLFCETGNRYRRAEIAACAVEKFEDNYSRFIKTEDISLLKEEYEEALVNRGKKVLIIEPSGEYEGTALGINRHGELLVEHEDGRRDAIFAGEVSVRGIYGYV